MKTYGQPLLYTVVAIAGLVTALLAEGALDWLALVLIAAPLYPILRAALPPRRTS